MAKTIDEQIEVMQAFKDGRKIECRPSNTEYNWLPAYKPIWNWEAVEYRIKKESKYRPYKNTEEMLNDFCKRFGVIRTNIEEPFIWVKSKDVEMKFLINAISYDICIIRDIPCPMEYLFANYTFLDGSPIGKMED